MRPPAAIYFYRAEITSGALDLLANPADSHRAIPVANSIG
jgi:hypothetical protein